MKRFLYAVALLIVSGICFQGFGQTAEKSSGVIKLNMKKKAPTRSNGSSGPVSISMEQKEAVELSGEMNGFTWITPTLSSVKTSEDTYQVQATVNSRENIRFINLFINGEFVRNIIPPVSTIKEMAIDEMLELSLGRNELRIEAVSSSGKKLESTVEIVYDISSAKYYALIIAVEKYNDPGINDLDQPVSDATRFMNIINTEYNFDNENILLLKNPTKEEIIGTLHKMRTVVTPEDNLLIYYAGHGLWDAEMSTGYWFPRDADPDNPVNWLPNTDLTNYLNVLKTKHTLLIADACFSGGIFKSRAAFNNVLSVERLYKLTSRKAITSGTMSEEVPDKSVFIEYLIKRLDDNNRKYMPSEQLYSSMKEAVMNNSPNIPLYGTIQNVGDEGGDFIFIRRD
ncbi:MAG: caspase family protein [Bacteroidales bacterium]|nr:caspase family protein [Bacteroidales bacterium]